jgi:nicotinate phosphoribosyltransferase
MRSLFHSALACPGCVVCLSSPDQQVPLTSSTTSLLDARPCEHRPSLAPLRSAFHGSFTVFAGLDECVDFLHGYKFTMDQLEYVRSLIPNAREEFFTEYLAELDCSRISVWAMREGSVALPHVPLLRVEGPLGAVQLLESTLLNLVGYSSLVATYAARHRIAAGSDATLVEFGLRRAQGPDGALRASKYAYLGGFDGTSNVLAGEQYRIPVKGTHAHSFVQSFSGLDDVPRHLSVTAYQKSREVSAEEFVRDVLDIRECLRMPEHRLNDGELAAFITYALSYVTASIHPTPRRQRTRLSCRRSLICVAPSFICFAPGDL